MSTFAIAGLQLELDHGDNIEVISEEVRALKRRFPWVEMVVIGELAAFGPKLDKAEALPGPAEATLRRSRARMRRLAAARLAL